MKINIESLLSVIEKVGAAASPFVPGVGAAIEAVEALVGFVQELKPTLDETSQAKLDAALPGLIDIMNSAVDQAGKDLGAT